MHVNVELTPFKISSVFFVVILAMIANGFWESYAEGRNAWDKGKLGPKINLGKYVITGYHFFLFGVMWPLILSLPLVIFGWDSQLFGVLVSAYSIGMIVEDFTWFVVNPKVKLSEFGPKFANYYPWISFGKFAIPVGYVVNISLAFLSWFVFWR